MGKTGATHPCVAGDVQREACSLYGHSRWEARASPLQSPFQARRDKAYTAQISFMSDIHPDIAKLVAAGKLSAHAAVKLTLLQPGVFCQHKSWGVGRVGSWELFDDKMIIDFEDRKGHALKLEFAAGSLNIVAESHILARRYSDPAALTKLS